MAALLDYTPPTTPVDPNAIKPLAAVTNNTQPTTTTAATPAIIISELSAAPW